MNLNILGVIGPGFLNQVPTLGLMEATEYMRCTTDRAWGRVEPCPSFRGQY